MNPTALLLRAYYEALHDFLIENRDRTKTAMNKTIAAELKKLKPADFNADKFDAYCEAAVAFLEERIEAYNPLGIQYTFDRPPTKLAQQLELQLNWFDSTKEFEELRQTAAALAEADMSDERLKELARRLVHRAGAFPDKTIIVAYEAAPALQKLPDYALAKSIEEIIAS